MLPIKLIESNFVILWKRGMSKEMLSKAAVLVVVSFLVIILIFGSAERSDVFAKLCKTAKACKTTPFRTIVPPASLVKAARSSNNTGNATTNITSTLPAQTITKEHNPASPNVFILAPNATNPTKNTPLTGQQTSGGHHHHKGEQTGTSSSSNTNSTGH
jgi:hypothetical protein